MDKNNLTVFEFEFNQNESVFQMCASSDKRWVTLPMEPATPKEWESWQMKKSLVEREMKQKLKQLHETFHEEMKQKMAKHHEKFNEEMKHQLNCLQEKTQQSFQNFQQELDAAYNGELLKLQNENEMLKKELEK